MRLIFGEMKAVLLTKFLDYKKQSSIHCNNGTWLRTFQATILGLFEQIFSLKISAQGQNLEKMTRYPMKDIKSFVLILIFHCFQRLHFLVEISKGGRNYARGCVNILIFLMSSNIASTDLHVAKSTYTHNLKVES